MIFDEYPCTSGLQCSAGNCSHFAYCASDGYSEEWIQLQIHQQRPSALILAIDGVEVTEVKRSEGALGTVVEGRCVGASCAIKRLRTEHATEYLSNRFLYDTASSNIQAYCSSTSLPSPQGWLSRHRNRTAATQPQPVPHRPAQSCSAPDNESMHSRKRGCSLPPFPEKPPIIIRELMSSSFMYLTPGLMAKRGPGRLSL